MAWIVVDIELNKNVVNITVEIGVFIHGQTIANRKGFFTIFANVRAPDI